VTSGRRAVLIAGPTASGKTALALSLAAERDVAIVNTDSMQVYQGLGVLTASPTAIEAARAPHHLFGMVPPSERFSTGAWLAAAKDIIDRTGTRHLVFVGGTGLYFEALTRGMAELPQVPEAVVKLVEADVLPLDRAGRARLLRERDPQMSDRLSEPDPQRVTRALSVLAATGRSLAEWQDDRRVGLLDGFEVERVVLDPEKSVLNARIAARFAAMFRNGAVEEVAALRRLDLDPTLPAAKAIGVREIAAWMDKEISEERAIELSIIATRQYAKRQRTWFRSRMADWRWIRTEEERAILPQMGR